MTTNEWRDAYEEEGCVDLWVEEEFNSGSRLMVSSAGPSFAAVDFTFLLLQTEVQCRKIMAQLEGLLV